MIGGSVDCEGHTSDFADDPAEVGVEIGFDFGGDEWGALFGAEDEMNEEICAGVADVLTPLRGFYFVSLPTHALRRGPYSCAAPQL